MREVIFVEKIVELPAFARAILRDDAQTGKLLVSLQPAPPHDESADNQFAHTRQFRERPSQPFGGHLQNLAFSRFASRACQCCCAHEHSHIAAKIAFDGGCEDLFLLVVACFEYFHLAAQDNDQRQIPLAGFEDQFAAPHDAAGAERLQHSELPVIQFCTSDALCVAIELLISLLVGHRRIVRYSYDLRAEIAALPRVPLQNAAPFRMQVEPKQLFYTC